jgi:hypothetical protein
MKHIYLLAIAIISFATSFAQTKINLSCTSGSWSVRSSWDLNRLPTSGDTVVVPKNTNLTISTDMTLNDMHVRIYGTVTLANNNTQINLIGNSDIVVYEGGKIEGTQASQKLRINGTLAYQGNNSAIYGPATATAALPSFGYYLLPVKFSGFSVARQNSDVLVQWATAEEINSGAFEIERSADGANWKKIAAVASKGSATTAANYSYTDKGAIAPVSFYRIKQVDTDGKFVYTAVKSIKSSATATEVAVAAISNRVVLQFSNQVKSAVEVRLVSLSGQVVSRQVLQHPVGQVVLNTGSVKGAYIVSVTNAADLNLAKQVVL